MLLCYRQRANGVVPDNNKLFVRVPGRLQWLLRIVFKQDYYFISTLCLLLHLVLLPRLESKKSKFEKLESVSKCKQVGVRCGAMRG